LHASADVLLHQRPSIINIKNGSAVQAAGLTAVADVANVDRLSMACPATRLLRQHPPFDV
jgi:hypothetical protein